MRGPLPTSYVKKGMHRTVAKVEAETVWHVYSEKAFVLSVEKGRAILEKAGA